MKFSGLYIRCKEGEEYKLKHFTFLEPDGFKEVIEALSQEFPTYIDGMVYMPYDSYQVIPKDIFQNVQKKTFDWVFVDKYGFIFKIERNVSGNKKIQVNKNTFAIIILKSGIADKHNLLVENLVVYKNFVMHPQGIC